MRPILKINYKLTALELLHQFKKGASHFALVYKNQYTLLGFITLDNLLHVLIGRIKDEFHKTQEDWVKQADGTITTKGDCSIYSLEQALECSMLLDSTEEHFRTLYGLIVHRNGVIPRVGDIIYFNEFDALIEKVEGQYLERIKITPKTPSSNF